MNNGKLSYTLSRHYQRYEYLIEKGYITDKIVIDVGAGSGYGAINMTSSAKFVHAFDPVLHKQIDMMKLLVDANGGSPYEINAINRKGSDRRKLHLHPVPIEYVTIDTPVDVCIAIEILEHVSDTAQFIDKLASLCEHAFFTTPLSDYTRKTRNTAHVYEYSAQDFQDIISKRFNILDIKYQLSTLEITNHAAYTGDSYDPGHVVQMAWCKSKEEE